MITGWQVPFPQLPEVHWLLAVHIVPLGRPASQMPLTQLPEVH
jgi:hypothetical protein